MSPHVSIPMVTRTALVADDHEVFRSALSAILKRQCGFHTVLEVASMDEAVDKLCESSGITFATFDLKMPGVRGAESLLSLRQVFPLLRAVVVAGSDRREDIFAAMVAGMHGYIPKSLPTPQIAAALHMVVEGMIFMPWSVAELPQASKFKIEAEEATHGCQATSMARLTPRQRDVLTCIRAGKSNKEIARALGLTESTIKVHTNALYRILGVRNRVGAASSTLA